MSEKFRPELISLPHPSVVVGTSPNPSNLSWPMSYANSFERSSTSPTTTFISHGTRYDPVRQGELPSPELPLPHLDSDSEKRKRDGYDYQEPQKIVQPSNSLQSSRRNHICPDCGASFTRQHNLKSHLLTHTSSKKEFNCTQCGNEFRRLHDLKRHQKLHTGEKPFACDVCGRRFARADALGRHTRSAGDAGCVNARKSIDIKIYESGGSSTSAQISPVEMLTAAAQYHATNNTFEERGLPSIETFAIRDLAQGHRSVSSVPSAIRDDVGMRNENSTEAHKELVERHERLEREHREALERLRELERHK